MNVIKTKKEFQLMKDEMIQKVDDFMKNFDDFSRSISPSDWRTIGSYYKELKKFKDDIPFFKPITKKDLEKEWVKLQVMTAEEKEIYKNSKKFNI
jgi:hypothetical protein